MEIVMAAQAEQMQFMQVVRVVVNAAVAVLVILQ
jgi:hypothetical protein